MGLDMYLDRVIETDSCPYASLACEWGKSSEVFRWFDKNVCGGNIENCTYYEVSREQLERLVSDCERVLEDHSLAREVLPAGSGGLQGGSDYDDLYFWDVEYTRKRISEILSEDEGCDRPVIYEFMADW